MSDYGGNDYDDEYDDEWLYLEDEYMQADDLAEHAVASPPPNSYCDDDLEEFDRFDYFNDLEYGDDGYDDGNFEPHSIKSGQPDIGQKRKRGVTATPSKKKQRVVTGQGKPGTDVAYLTNAPIVWRARADRGTKLPPMPDNAKPYAVLKDWRQKLDKTPGWVTSRSRTPGDIGTSIGGPVSLPSDPRTTVEEDGWDDDEEAGIEDDEGIGEEGAAGVDPAAIMAALQARLASAGGPLSGMDPQQLLQYAMRMANGEGEGDDIAGEMADELLDQGEEDEEDEEAEAKLQSRVKTQRDANPVQDMGIAAGKSSASTPRKAPTSSAAKAKHSVQEKDEDMLDAELDMENGAQDDNLEVKQTTHNLEVKQTSRKRKADTTDSGTASPPKPKKRATRSFAAPTAASQAKAGPAKTTRSGRVKR